ncbi:hypothetical protein BGX24_006916, partial [Mortierella sp. AD032]
TLKLHLQKCGAIAEAGTRFIVDGVSADLVHLHGEDQIHCGIKPDNIPSAPGMRVHVGGLGISEKYSPNTKDD